MIATRRSPTVWYVVWPDLTVEAYDARGNRIDTETTRGAGEVAKTILRHAVDADDLSGLWNDETAARLVAAVFPAPRDLPWSITRADVLRFVVRDLYERTGNAH